MPIDDQTCCEGQDKLLTDWVIFQWSS